jgi:hypothetical protein
VPELEADERYAAERGDVQRGDPPSGAVARRILEWVSGLSGDEGLALDESGEPACLPARDTRWIAVWAGLGIEPWRPARADPGTDKLATSTGRCA